MAWKLCGTMRSEDFTDTFDIALAASGRDSAKVLHKLRLLDDNGSYYIAGNLAEYLADKGMKHIRGAPLNPQMQRIIERWRQTLAKARIERLDLDVRLSIFFSSQVNVGLRCLGGSWMSPAPATKIPCPTPAPTVLVFRCVLPRNCRVRCRF